MDARSKQTTALALDLFEKFSTAATFESIISIFRELCSLINVSPTQLSDFFPVIKECLTSNEIRELLSKYETRVAHKAYKNGRVCRGTNVLIVGAGPCGLRTAIETQLLGARVVLIEKRREFSRNNVLHIWPFVIADLRGLGAKRFCPRFCAGSIDHVSISGLQCILLKIALLLGVEVVEGIEFQGLTEPSEGDLNWRAVTSPTSSPISDSNFDVVIGADGRGNVLPGFKRKELRAKLAIAITANFVNHRSAAEARVQEISGVSFIFKQSFFQELCQSSGIDLENIVYYKDETHYFVMTAKKHSLLWKGVLKENYAETEDLLAPSNIDTEALQNYTLEAVNFATEGQIPNLEFALNARGQPDVAIFDFTTMYAAENACRVLERKGCKLLLGLVGDSLLEPFWPTGSGCARGFLSSLDAAWMIRSWSRGEDVLDVLAERETIYRLLAQTTHENLNKDFGNYAVDPQSRYPNLVLGTVKPFQVKPLYDKDDRDQIEPNLIKAPATDSTNTKKCYGGKHLTRSKTLIEPRSKGQGSRNLDIGPLVLWVEEAVGQVGVEVKGILDLFLGGNALPALIHYFRPDLIPEFPFPPEFEAGIEELDLAGFRNQIAFDFLHEEYQLPYVVSGYESVQYTSEHLAELVNYLGQVRELLTSDEESHSAVHLPETCQNSKTESESHTILHSRPPNPVKTQPSRIKINRSATMPAFDVNRKPVRPPGAFGCSVRRIQSRFEGTGTSFEAGSEEDVLDRENEDFFGIANEGRLSRQKEADRCKAKAMKFIAMVQGRRAEALSEANATRRERAIRSIKAIHVTVPEPLASPASTTVEKDDFFNEYNMRLWRVSVPTIDERREKLENVFGPNLPSKASKPKAQPQAKATAQPVSKINKEDWVMKLLAEKFGEGQGHSTIRTDLGQGQQDGENGNLPVEPEQDTESSVPTDYFQEENGTQELGKCDPDPDPEEYYYSATATTSSCAYALPERAEMILGQHSKGPIIREDSSDHDSLDLDEIDEEALAQLDPKELEQLEAWSGKYL